VQELKKRGLTVAQIVEWIGCDRSLVFRYASEEAHARYLRQLTAARTRRQER
jgi:hypothetical protein